MFFNKGLFILVLVILVFVVFIVFLIRYIRQKKMYLFKVYMFMPRQNTYIMKGYRAAVIKDEKGIELFSIKTGFKKYLTTRQVPPQNLILPDNSIFVKKVGINDIVYLSPNINKKEGFDLEPIDANIKFATLYEIKKANSIIKPFGSKLKEFLPQIGIIVMFGAAIVLCYIVYKNMDLGAVANAAKINVEVAKSNQQTVQALEKVTQQLVQVVQRLK